MRLMTVDTAWIIHGAQAGDDQSKVDQLVDLAKVDRVGIWITSTALHEDLSRAGDEQRQTNLRWLAGRPVIGSIPAPFRFDYSFLDAGDVFLSDEDAEVGARIERILLSPLSRTGAKRRRAEAGDESAIFDDRDRRNITDVQHLHAHHMAGHDAFVTTDRGDMLRRRDQLLHEVGIRVVTPSEAVALVLDEEPPEGE